MHAVTTRFILLCRITSIDIKYQIWKFGVVFTDNVSQKTSLLIKDGDML